MFVEDACKVSSLIIKENKNVSFVNFATNSILVKTKGIINTLFKILDGKVNYAVGVDNKYNAKNH